MLVIWKKYFIGFGNSDIISLSKTSFLKNSENYARLMWLIFAKNIVYQKKNRENAATYLIYSISHSSEF